MNKEQFINEVKNSIEERYLYSSFKNKGLLIDNIPTIVNLLTEKNGNKVRVSSCVDYIKNKMYPNIKPLTETEVKLIHVLNEFKEKHPEMLHTLELSDGSILNFDDFVKNIAKDAIIDENNNIVTIIEYAGNIKNNTYSLDRLYEEFRMKNTDGLTAIHSTLLSLEQQGLISDELLTEPYNEEMDLLDYLSYELPKLMINKDTVQITEINKSDSKTVGVTYKIAINEYIYELVKKLKIDAIKKVINEKSIELGISNNDIIKLTNKLINLLPEKMNNLTTVMFDSENGTLLVDIVDEALAHLKEDKYNRVGENPNQLGEIPEFVFNDSNVLNPESNVEYFNAQLSRLKESIENVQTIEQLKDVSIEFQSFCTNYDFQFMQTNKEAIEKVNEVIINKKTELSFEEEASAILNDINEAKTPEEISELKKQYEELRDTMELKNITSINILDLEDTLNQRLEIISDEMSNQSTHTK